MKDLNQLQEFYNSELMPVLTGFETRRKEIASKTFTAAGIIAILAGIGGIIAMSASHSPFGLLIAAVGGLVIFGIARSVIVGPYTDNFKVEIVSRIARFIDPNLNFAPKQYIPETTFRSSRLYEQRSDRYDGEDMISGMVGKTQISFCELHSEYETTSTDSKGHTTTTWHTIFKGVFFIADFNKHFNGSTIIVPDSGGGFLGKFFEKFSSNGQLVKLEDPEFEKLFTVYGSDQIEARYILSPALMQRLTEFRRQTNKTMRISFINSNIYIAIENNKNLFEPKMGRSALDFTTIAEYYNDMATLIGIVETLNLNTRIWTKQ